MMWFVLLAVLLTTAAADDGWTPVSQSFNTKHFGKQGRTRCMMESMLTHLETCVEESGCPRTTANGDKNDRGCVGDMELCPRLLSRLSHPLSVLSYAGGVGEEVVALHAFYNGTAEVFYTDLDDATVDKAAARPDFKDFGVHSFHIDRANDRTYDVVLFNFALFARVKVEKYATLIDTLVELTSPHGIVVLTAYKTGGWKHSGLDHQIVMDYVAQSRDVRSLVMLGTSNFFVAAHTRLGFS